MEIVSFENHTIFHEQETKGLPTCTVLVPARRPGWEPFGETSGKEKKDACLSVFSSQRTSHTHVFSPISVCENQHGLKETKNHLIFICLKTVIWPLICDQARGGLSAIFNK